MTLPPPPPPPSAPPSDQRGPRLQPQPQRRSGMRRVCHEGTPPPNIWGSGCSARYSPSLPNPPPKKNPVNRLANSSPSYPSSPLSQVWFSQCSRFNQCQIDFWRHSVHAAESLQYSVLPGILHPVEVASQLAQERCLGPLPLGRIRPMYRQNLSTVSVQCISTDISDSI